MTQPDDLKPGTYFVTIQADGNVSYHPEVRRWMDGLFAAEHARLLVSLREKMPEPSDISFLTAVHKPQSFNHGYGAGRNVVINTALAAIDAELDKYKERP